MAEVVIPITRVTREGEDLDTAVADGGDGLVIERNDGLVTLEVTGDGTLTVHKGASVGSATFAPDEVDLTGADRKRFGPYPPALYNRADGSVLVEASGTLVVAGQRI